MLEKVAEVMPNWIEVKTVVGVKYIKMLDKKQVELFFFTIQVKCLVWQNKWDIHKWTKEGHLT